ncbi:MAG: ATP-dependent zinc protease [Armatimonadetes bacterium]|nr:ATP-dependent zinc protease [Armatimonadota bacterium]
MKATVGWREYVSLPDWGITDLRAKIDTGARTSAIHVEDLDDLGNDRIRFDVVLSRLSRHKRVTVEATAVRRSHVRSSNGDIRERYFVRTVLRIGPIVKTVEVSLVNRDNMNVRMLVGRSALDGSFTVDPELSYVQGKVGR